MIIKCPQCETAFNIPDAKISATGIRAKCYKCANVFSVRKPESPSQEVSVSSDAVPNPLSIEPDSPQKKLTHTPVPEQSPPSKEVSEKEEKTEEMNEDLFSEEAITLAANQMTPEMKRKLEQIRLNREAQNPKPQPISPEPPVSSGKIPSVQASPPSARISGQRRSSPIHSVSLNAAKRKPVRRSVDWIIFLLLTTLFSGAMIWGINFLWGQKGIIVRNVSYYTIHNQNSGDLVILRGMALNRMSQTVDKIRVSGELLGPSDEVIDKQTAYCGNLYTDKELETWNADKIKTHGERQQGEEEINLDIHPSFGLACMVVFNNPSKPFTAYRMLAAN